MTAGAWALLANTSAIGLTYKRRGVVKQPQESALGGRRDHRPTNRKSARLAPAIALPLLGPPAGAVRIQPMNCRTIHGSAD